MSDRKSELFLIISISHLPMFLPNNWTKTIELKITKCYLTQEIFDSIVPLTSKTMNFRHFSPLECKNIPV